MYIYTHTVVHPIFHSPLLKLQPSFSCFLPFHILNIQLSFHFSFSSVNCCFPFYIFKVFNIYYAHTIPAVVRAVDAMAGS